MTSFEECAREVRELCEPANSAKPKPPVNRTVRP